MSAEQMEYLEDRSKKAYQLLVSTGVLKALAGSDSLERPLAELEPFTGDKSQVKIEFWSNNSPNIYYLGKDNKITGTKVDLIGPNKGKYHVFATLSPEQADEIRMFAGIS